MWTTICRKRVPSCLKIVLRNNSTISIALDKIKETQPTIQATSKNIEILKTPTQFYSTLLDNIRKAEKRIFLSSLYVGHDEYELLQAIEAALRNKPNLRVNFQLDYFRSTRPGPDSTALALVPLLKRFPDRVQAHLYRSPTLKGLMAKIVPRRFDEGWGTWHAKVYGFDDDVVISGANLNRSYFVNRQDRYLVFKKNKRLANYCSDFLRIFSKHSYELKPSPDNLGYLLEWTPEMVPYGAFPTHLKKDIEEFQAENRQRLLAEEQDTKSDVQLVPMIQSGPLHVREEETALYRLFGALKASPTAMIDLTSGYFSLYKLYHPQVFDSRCRWRILAASPKANGFYGSKGISGRIPHGYTILESQFWNGVKGAGKEQQVELREWERPEWTYHAKGIWIRPSIGQNPVVTVFGSTNLNSRSANLDTELSFIMHTTSEELQQNLDEEAVNIWQNSEVVDENTWKKPERSPSWTTHIITALVRNML
ncbi:phospholipase D/nuclease [Serendipita vermifera]|nr:phospholipase D/nuclease [Serendipita vermifera]